MSVGTNPQRRHLAEFPTRPRQSVRPSMPANPEQLRICAHAHGIKSVNRKYSQGSDENFSNLRY